MLSLNELRRAARSISEGLARARVERVVQPTAESLALLLYDGDAKRTLFLSCRPEFARVSERASPPAAAATPPSFQSFLRSRLGRARLEGARIEGSDRQLVLRFESSEGPIDLLLSFLGRRSNLYALDAEGCLLRSLRPLADTRGELKVGEPWQSPRTPVSEEGGDRFQAHPDAELLEAIEAHYAPLEHERGSHDLERRLGVALRKERKHAGRRLEKLEAELAEADQASELQRRGELLKGLLGKIAPGDTEIRALDHASGEQVTIPLDPTKSPKQNLEATFKRYQKLIRRLTKAGGQVDEARARCEALEALGAELESASASSLPELAARPELASLLKKYAPASSGAAAPAPEPERGPLRNVEPRLRPRRYRSSDGLEIWVGRSDAGNDHLSTRLARGKDLFFHLDGAPGSHVVLRTEGRSDPPSESLLEASELAVHFSKAKNATRADVHVVPIKQVKKPKGAKAGLVWVTGGRTLHLRREEARLRRILDARIDD